MTLSSDIASLEVSGPQGERTIPLKQGTTWRIGRNEPSEVVLDDEMVSRNHAILQRLEDGQFYLIDMGSRNGSFVNGARVSVPRALNDGDSILIGDTVLIFRCAGLETQTSEDQTDELGETIEDRTEDITTGSFKPLLITVLVVDIRDFTKLTQQVDQTVLCNLIAGWFRQGGRIMRDRGSWSQKYIGDALMAIWLHQTYGQERQEILSVIRACEEFAEVTGGLQAQFSLPVPLRIGAGVNTGMGTVGNAGTTDAMDFTAMGETVNAAFRIESSTKEIGLEMAIGKSTYLLLSEGADLGEYFQAHVVTLKGYDRPTEVWGAPFEALRQFLDTQGG